MFRSSNTHMVCISGVEVDFVNDGLGWIHYRPDSNLLIITGGSEFDPKGRYGIDYFLWDGVSLKEIRYIPQEQVCKPDQFRDMPDVDPR